MRRGPVRILVELAALSAALTWLWLAFGQSAYEHFFARTAQPLLAALGADGLADSPARRRFVSYVPFLVLMLGTPRLEWRRRLGGILLGMPLIFACHGGLGAVGGLSPPRPHPPPAAHSV